MNTGLKQKDIQFILDNLKKNLPKGSTVWCFGSRARGDFKEMSDLDIVIKSDNLSVSDIGKIDEIFVESNLPIKIDIVNFNNLASSYKKGFEKDKILLLET